MAGTLVAVYGFLMEPIGWLAALGIWGFAIAEILLLTAVRVASNRMLRSILGERPSGASMQQEARRA